MHSGRRKNTRQGSRLTSDYHADRLDEDSMQSGQRFSRRSAGAEQRKIEKTALLRAAEEDPADELQNLPIGQVTQVYSLFYDVEQEGVTRLCVLRKTLAKLNETAVVVGDNVRFRESGTLDDQGRPEAVIEQILPRTTVLMRADSHKAIERHPIVANAQQMLIVASLRDPEIRWGLIDRMIIACRCGNLRPLLCINKIDQHDPASDPESAAVLEVYRKLGVEILCTSTLHPSTLDSLRAALAGKTTVLAGHSGVGKSSLIRAIQPHLVLKVGQVSGYTGKGRHTTSSARRFPLDFGGWVMDTPGVKMFALWGITRDSLMEHFPDVENGTAPQWRNESYQRILESLPG